MAVGIHQALVNRQILFRRALKLRRGGINAGVSSLPDSGLTVASENPVYVQGNYNATTDSAAEPNRPAAILADAVTLLSNNWNDLRSIRNPNDSLADLTSSAPNWPLAAATAGSRRRPGTVSPSWPARTRLSRGRPAPAQHFLYGTDGGVGNFLRLLEDWNEGGAVAVNYTGSIVSLFYSRQAVGSFRYSTDVYNYADRNFTFDSGLPAAVAAAAGHADVPRREHAHVPAAAETDTVDHGRAGRAGRAGQVGQPGAWTCPVSTSPA